ncbi:MAG: Pectate lyase superfamily protein, partial [Bacteroidota bacterium]
MYNSFRRFILIIFISWSCNKSNHFINTNQPQHINIKDYGAIGDGISDDTQAFNLGMQKANSSHLPLYIPSGIYKASVLLSFDSLNIIGEKQPDQNLTYGTIILGYINCNNKKNISIINLGIDSRGKLGTQDAALSSGDGIDSVVLHQKFQNISLIGDG